MPSHKDYVVRPKSAVSQEMSVKVCVRRDDMVMTILCGVGVIKEGSWTI